MNIFRNKKSDIFHISTQNIDCGYSLEPPRRGGSNEYLQSMFLSRNKKNSVYPCKPQFYYIKVVFKGVKIYRRVFMMNTITTQTAHIKSQTYKQDEVQQRKPFWPISAKTPNL